MPDPIATARPLSEWHEDFGDVLWWKFPIEEAPWVGTPLTIGPNTSIRLELNGEPIHASVRPIGGWPGYHTHWTPLPAAPAEPEQNTNG